MNIPDELRTIHLPQTWGEWNILSGKELEIPNAWIAPLSRFLGLEDDSAFYLLEVKVAGAEKSALLESQMLHSLSDKELGLMDGIIVPVPVRIALHFDAAGGLTNALREPPSDRDLKAAARHVVGLLDRGEVDLPGKQTGLAQPWRIVQQNDGRFRLERAYLA